METKTETTGTARNSLKPLVIDENETANTKNKGIMKFRFYFEF